MCAVSMVYDYGRDRILDWNRPGIIQFKKLVEEAKKFDEVTNQPDCEDPEKAKFMEELDRKLAIHGF